MLKPNHITMKFSYRELMDKLSRQRGEIDSHAITESRKLILRMHPDATIRQIWTSNDGENLVVSATVD